MQVKVPWKHGKPPTNEGRRALQNHSFIFSEPEALEKSRWRHSAIPHWLGSPITDFKGN